MRTEFLSKNFNPSENLKDLIAKKVERLDKFFEEDTKIKVVMKQTHDVQTLEFTIIVDSTVLRAEVSGGDMYENIDIALPKLEKQIIKNREKLISKSKKFRFKEIDIPYIPAIEQEKKRAVVRTKSYTLNPMTVEDAIDELELVGHSFYVFTNKSTKLVNVIYKRNDGDYGVIEARQ